LEIGCGSGLGAVFLGQHCRSVFGIDVKEHEVAEARSINRRSNVSFERGDVFQYSFRDRYDAVVALDVIEHMEEAQGRAFVEKTAELIGEMGMVIIGTPSRYCAPHQSAFSKAGHVKMYDQEELVELVEGFYGRALAFSMNDELVHTGNPKMAWYYFVLGLLPGKGRG
jgi:2-polyprenyl-3-methyl-5-hydroxy-6-metoxy-1,4-benzoquinol methylase